MPHKKNSLMTLKRSGPAPNAPPLAGAWLSRLVIIE